MEFTQNGPKIKMKNYVFISNKVIEFFRVAQIISLYLCLC